MEKNIESNNNIERIGNIPESDFWNDLPGAVKHAIDQAKAEFDRGEGIPHSHVMAELKDRFLNRR